MFEINHSSLLLSIKISQIYFITLTLTSDWTLISNLFIFKNPQKPGSTKLESPSQKFQKKISRINSLLLGKETYGRKANKEIKPLRYTVRSLLVKLHEISLLFSLLTMNC